MSSNVRVHGEPGTLYARCGGAFGVAAFVDNIMDRWMEDPVLNANTAVATWHQRLQRCGFKFLVTQYLCDRIGGPHRYTGRPIDVAHKHLNISPKEWTRFMEIFAKACKDNGLDPTTSGDLKKLFDSLREPCVVEPPEEAPPNPGPLKLQGNSLYARLGGVYALALFADRLVDSLLVDDRVHIPCDDTKRNAASLKFFFTEVACAVTGGPEAITCKDYDGTKLLVPGSEWSIFSKTAEVAADHMPAGLNTELVQALEGARMFIVDPATADHVAPPSAVLLAAARVKDVQAAGAGKKVSKATLAARQAAPGSHVAARRRVFGDPRTLYGRGGGVFGLARLSSRLMDVWMSNPKLNANAMVARWHTSQQKYGFKFLVTQIMGYLTGGPQRYTGRPMDAAHKHLVITPQQWDSFIADAESVFDEFKIEAATKKDLLGILVSFKEQCIVPPGERAPPDPGPSKPSPTLSHTLFFRLGGVYPIARFVDALVDSVLLDDRMHVDFEPVEALEGSRQPPGLKYVVTELVCEGTGGEEVVTSKGLDDAKLGVQVQEWPAFLAHAAEAAAEVWPEQGLRQELLAALEPMKPEICEGPLDEDSSTDTSGRRQLTSADFGREVRNVGSDRPAGASENPPQRPAAAVATPARPKASEAPAAAQPSCCPFAAWAGGGQALPEGHPPVDSARTGASTQAASSAATGQSSAAPPGKLWHDLDRRDVMACRTLGSKLQQKLDELLSEDPDLCCPISLMLFVDPAKASDGFVYENVSIRTLSRANMASPMSHARLTNENTPAKEEKKRALKFREERAESLLEFVEEAKESDPVMAVTGLERVGEYVQVLKPDRVPSVVQKASQAWKSMDRPVPPELVGTVRHRGTTCTSTSSFKLGEESRELQQLRPSTTKKSEADFRAYLDMLLSTPNGGEALARKLYPRFDGHMNQLQDLLQLLEERWGFPERLTPLLWTHLRRAIFLRRGTNMQVLNDSAGPVGDEKIEEEEWVDAFVRWLQAMAARVNQAQVSRQVMVQRMDSSIEFSGVYFKGPKLGEGAYGEVFVMYHKTLGEERVVKVIDANQMSMAKEDLEAEVDILKSLDHPHIVRIYETFDQGDYLHIVMDYAEGGDLASVLRDQQDEGSTLAEAWVRTAVQQMLGALEYMHSKGVIHCDLKPANSMLLRPFSPNSSPHVVLVDFGLSELFVERHRDGPVQVKGTPLYLSPEAFEGKVTEKSDMWAIGVMIYEMVLGKKPFNEQSVFVLWTKIARTEPDLEGLSELAREVVKALLTKDPATRLRARDCRSMAWFKDSAASDELMQQSRLLKSTGNVSYFHRAAMFCMAAELSMKDMPEIYEVFQAVDTDRTGSLSLEELTEALRQLGVEQDPAQLMQALDLDQNGSISYTEFLAGSLSADGNLSDRLLRQAFDMFDLDGDGTISMNELRVMLSGDGPLVDVLPDGQTVAQIMDEVGSGMGSITFESFREYLNRGEDATGVERHKPSQPQIARGGVSQMFEELERIPMNDRGSVPQGPGSREVEESPPAPLAERPGPGRRSSPERRAQLAEAEGPPLPALHQWLLGAFDDPRLSATLRKLLDFPNQRPSAKALEESLPAITRHLMAGICLVRLLAQGAPPQREEGLKEYVATATEALVLAALSPKDEPSAHTCCRCRQRRRSGSKSRSPGRDTAAE